MLNLNKMSHHKIKEANDDENQAPITICSSNVFKDSDFTSWLNVYTDKQVADFCLNKDKFMQQTSFWGRKLGNSWINP